MSSSNTAKKQKGKGPYRPPKGIVPPQLKGFQFKKGDPRINRKGRPKAHDFIRDLIQEIGAMEVEKNVNLIEAAILRAFTSSDPKTLQLLIEHGYGKVPDEVRLNIAKVIRVSLAKKGADAIQEQEAADLSEDPSLEDLQAVEKKIRNKNKARQEEEE